MNQEEIDAQTEQEITLEDLQVRIDNSRHLIKVRDAIVRLSENKDFKLVIEETFLKDEVLRATYLTASVTTDEGLARIHKTLNAAAILRQFLRGVMERGAVEDQDIVELERAYNESEVN